jgi:GNAT superfamily N-acetyltransferase
MPPPPQAANRLNCQSLVQRKWNLAGRVLQGMASFAKSWRMTITITPSDPDAPQAIACLRAYFGELAAIFPGGFDPGPLPGTDSDDMRPPKGAFLLAHTADGTSVGCVALRRQAMHLGEVKRLWIAPSQRSAGLASRMMSAIEDQARLLGMTRLVLDTSRHLPKAVAFYQRHGWAEIARYNDNPYAHHWFARDLPQN